MRFVSSIGRRAGFDDACLPQSNRCGRSQKSNKQTVKNSERCSQSDNGLATVPVGRPVVKLTRSFGGMRKLRPAERKRFGECATDERSCRVVPDNRLITSPVGGSTPQELSMERTARHNRHVQRKSETCHGWLTKSFRTRPKWIFWSSMMSRLTGRAVGATKPRKMKRVCTVFIVNIKWGWARQSSRA